MWRAIFAAACLAFALTMTVGCAQNQGGAQPKLANPDDPKIKVLAPVPVGGGPKGAGNKANPI